MATFTSSEPNTPAVDAEHTQSGTAVVANSFTGMGVHGVNDAPRGATIKPNFGCGVWGESSNGYGVYGSSDNASGVVGESTNNIGVNGQSVNNVGVLGRSTGGNAMEARAGGHPSIFGGPPSCGYGLLGVLTATPDTFFNFGAAGAGVAGASTTNCGVLGVSAAATGFAGAAGVEGRSTTTGVLGNGSANGVVGAGDVGVAGQGGTTGVSGTLDTTTGNSAFGFLAGRDPVFNEFAGVYGESDGAGVYGNSNATGGTGLHGRGGGVGGFGVRGEVGNGVAAVQGQTFGTGLAGNFIGKVHIQGDLEVTGDVSLVNGDCAEHFSVGTPARVEPGTVMVIADDGLLYPAQRAYDTRVVGVLAGAGVYRPGIILDTGPGPGHRQPVAILGKVCCKVDASAVAVAVGDLLTSSPRPGHAMKVTDTQKAFGAVIGKALAPLNSGQGLIPVLVALQ